MEIKEFVAETITQIIDGVRIAQDYAKTVGAVVNAGEKYGSYEEDQNEQAKFTSPLAQNIEFEVYITTSDSTQVQKGLQVFFPPLKSGLSATDKTAESSFNRILFNIPVAYPRQLND